MVVVISLEEEEWKKLLYYVFLIYDHYSVLFIIIEDIVVHGDEKSNLNPVNSKAYVKWKYIKRYIKIYLSFIF